SRPVHVVEPPLVLSGWISNHLSLTAPPPHSLIDAKDSGEGIRNHVYRPQRQVPDWPGGAPSGLSVPRCNLRYRPKFFENGGVGPVNSAGGAACQGSALLSPSRRERGQRVHRLRLGTESRPGCVRRTVASPTGL